MNALTVKNSSFCATAEYSVCIDGDPSLVVLPALTLKIRLRLVVNETVLGPSDYGGLIEEMALNLVSSSIWKSLQYMVDMNLEYFAEYAVSIILACNMCGEYVSDIGLAVSLMRLLDFAINLNSGEEEVSLHLFLDTCNYLLVSWQFNMEVKYPFVFSVYARYLLRLNYAYNMQMIKGLFSAAEIPRVMALQVSKLEKYSALQECNIFNVLKEIDASKSKYIRMQREKELYNFGSPTGFCGDDPKSKLEINLATNIKGRVYSIKFLDTIKIVEAIRQNQKGQI